MPPLEDDHSQFDAAFKEFTSAKAAATPPAAPPVDAPAPPAEPKVEPKQPAAEPKSTADTKPADQSAQRPAQNDAAAPSRGEAASSDPAAQTRPPTLDELQSQLAELRHRERSASARNGGYQRSINQLESRLAEIIRERDALKAAAAKPAAAPTSAPAPDDADDADDGLADAPDLRKAVQRRVEKAVARALAPVQQQLEAATARLAEVDGKATQAIGQIGPIAQSTQEQQWEQARAQLRTRFGDWNQTIETDSFRDWLEGQPDPIRSMYPGRDYHEAAKILTLFHAETGAPIPKAPPAQQAPAPPASQQGPAASAAAVNAERLRQAAGIAPGGGRPPVMSADPNDFHGAFAEFAAARRRA